MSKQLLHFYDSANAANIPSGVHAAAYINGFKWSAADMARMSGIFRVSVEREASWAREARCIDVETGAAQPSDVIGFVKERRRLGFDDATAYVNRSNWPLVRDFVREAKIEHPFYWVATLDGTMDVEQDGVKAWAVQYFGGDNTRFDLSVLHGVNNFHHFSGV